MSLTSKSVYNQALTKKGLLPGEYIGSRPKTVNFSLMIKSALIQHSSGESFSSLIRQESTFL